MEKDNQKDFLSGFHRIIGIALEFFIFNIINGIIFYLVFLQQHIIFKILYFIILFFEHRFAIFLSNKFISKFVMRYRTVNDLMLFIYQRRKFSALTIIYGISYFSANYFFKDRFTSIYSSGLFVSYFIGWIYYKVKINRHIKLLASEKKSK